MKYTINELANSKGVSQPVREALLQMEDELEATNRQVEILSDALAESRREVAAKDEALKLALEVMHDQGDVGVDEWIAAEAAIKQALAAPTSAEYAMGYAEGFNDGCKPAPTVRPVAFLANGTRFKISYDSRQSGGQIHGIPPELGGRWVAFVEAEDDCHLKLATPPAAQRQWVGLTDEEIEKACVPLGAAILSFTEVARAIEAKLKEKNT
jgi:hypothetical protein